MIDIDEILNEEADNFNKIGKQYSARLKNTGSTIKKGAKKGWKDLKNIHKDIASDAKKIADKGLNVMANAGIAGSKLMDKVGDKATDAINHPVQTAKDAFKGSAKFASRNAEKIVGAKQNIPQEMMIYPSKILAKLHLSGKQQGETNDIQILNTGIVNDAINGPDKVGKTDFKLESKDGKYQIGVITKIKYRFDPIEVVGIKELQEKKNKIKEQFKIDPTIDVDSKIKEIEEKKEDSTIEDDVKQKTDKKKSEELENLKKAKEELDPIQKEIRKALEKKAKEQKIDFDSKLNNDQLYSLIVEAMTIPGIVNAKNKVVEEKANSQEIQKAIDTYMKYFAGDLYVKPNSKDSFNSYVEVSEGFSGLVKDSQKYIKDFKIVGFSQKEIDENMKKPIEEAKKKQFDYDFETTICFRYEFELKTK